MNKYRESKGLKAFLWDSQMADISYPKAQSMADTGRTGYSTSDMMSRYRKYEKTTERYCRQITENFAAVDGDDVDAIA